MQDCEGDYHGLECTWDRDVPPVLDFDGFIQETKAPHANLKPKALERLFCGKEHRKARPMQVCLHAEEAIP